VEDGGLWGFIPFGGRALDLIFKVSGRLGCTSTAPVPSRGGDPRTLRAA
jgi:hypothetical protein